VEKAVTEPGGLSGLINMGIVRLEVAFDTGDGVWGGPAIGCFLRSCRLVSSIRLPRSTHLVHQAE
jgi:hypothetical protein